MSATNRNYADLIAWQKAMNLAESVYRVSKTLPRHERYGLMSQMRRAAVSIPSNIAEGEGRRTPGQFLHMLAVSYGSLRELETQAILAERLQLVTEDDGRQVIEECAEVGRLLNGLMKSLRRRAAGSS
jgi:four helix bundle protein